MLTDEFGEPFYVGVTYDLKKRLQEHISDSVRKMERRDHGSWKERKVYSLLKKGQCISIKIIQQTTIEEGAFQSEKFWITFLRHVGFNLTNITKGGKGGPYQLGKKRSPETCKRISESKKGTKWGHHTEATKKKMSEAKKGKKFSKKHRKNLSKAWKNRVVTEETKLKIIKASTGKINIKEFKVTDSNGVAHITTEGLTQFCKKHELSPPNMIKVANGERPHHKGWKCKRI